MSPPQCDNVSLSYAPGDMRVCLTDLQQSSRSYSDPQHAWRELSWQRHKINLIRTLNLAKLSPGTYCRVCECNKSMHMITIKLAPIMLFFCLTLLFQATGRGGRVLGGHGVGTAGTAEQTKLQNNSHSNINVYPRTSYPVWQIFQSTKPPKKPF